MKAPERSALISLQGAGVRYGAVQALQGVDLVLRRGDRLALVGANGSGKTTLLKLLHGLAPCEGRREVRPLEPERRPLRAAMLFQRPFLLNMSVGWNLRVALWLQGAARADRLATCERALGRVGLASLADRPARALSGGQQQRLALARAWAARPDVLFLDEPTASMDPSAKREVEQLMAEFADEGMTLVFSTHNLGQAKRQATRVACLDGGRLLADSTTDHFFNDPALPAEVQQFLRGELPWLT
jgi:tungstate transport system ATP-binding protein